jgi:sodium-dependent phosphate cotransporter
VSVGHISRPAEFKRAFAAATVHDFFNVMAVIILFPIQVSTNLLGKSATVLANGFEGIGGLKLSSPIKLITKPAVHWVSEATGETGWLMLIISVALLFIALRYVVVLLRGMVIGRVQTFFNEKLFVNAVRAFAVGLALTVAVQSSSITTSLAVPLAGAGILTLAQIFPMTLGANVGTTITALLASLATGNPAAVTVAFAHLLFNVFGIAIIWPFRRLPMWMAETLAGLALRSKLIPVLYILVLFYIVPLTLISFLG